MQFRYTAVTTLLHSLLHLIKLNMLFLSSLLPLAVLAGSALAVALPNPALFPPRLPQVWLL